MSPDITPMTSTPTLHDRSEDSEIKEEAGSSTRPISPASQLHSQDHGVLPAGCTWGPNLYLTPHGVSSRPPLGGNGLHPVSSLQHNQDRDVEKVRVIWVDFPLGSSENPFSFSKRRKAGILLAAVFFAEMCSMHAGAYSVGIPSMQKELGTTDLQAAAGVSLYPWGFSLGPLILAPITEEFGRYWSYIGSVTGYSLLHLMQALAPNTATVLVGRFLIGLAGCIGSTVVAGTVADLYTPDKRGGPMALFTLNVVLGPGLGGGIFCWVEANPHLQWRWIVWIQLIILGAYFPLAAYVLGETRAPVILRRKAKKLRTERGLQDGGRYTARSEVDKQKFWPALQSSLKRPLLFLALEPIVTFFAIWAALVWGVLFIELAGLDYVFTHVHGFNTTQAGSVFWCLSLGGVFGYLLNFVQDRWYTKYFPTHGVEARLYMPMISGLMFAVGCIIFGLTSVPSIHWIAPCIGIVILMTGAFAIYQTAFLYLSQCYGTHASSAVAGMSFLRIILGSSFAMFTDQLFVTLTPRWGLFLMGCIALLLAPIPFIAYFRGPWIRERSPYSKILMAEERRRIEAEGLLEALEKEAARGTSHTMRDVEKA